MADLFTGNFLTLDHKFSKSISIYSGYVGYNAFVVLRFILKALEWSGHGVPWILYAMWGMYSHHNNNKNYADNENFRLYSVLMIGLILDLIVIAILKLTFRRPRPEYNQGDLPLSASKIDSFSFPSGHATRAFMVYITIKQFLPARESLTLLWAILLSYSRVALGRHFLSDVIVGIIVGIMEGLLTIYLGSVIHFLNFLLF